MIEMGKVKLKTAFGTFNEMLFSDGNKSAYVLMKGNVKNKEKVLCRIHSECISGHYFYSIDCDCSKQMIFSQKIIEEENQGIIIWLEQEGKGNGHYAKMSSEKYKAQGFNQSDAYIKAGYPADNRNYYEIEKLKLGEIEDREKAKKKEWHDKEKERDEINEQIAAAE